MSEEAEQLLEWVSSWQWARLKTPGSDTERLWHSHCAHLAGRLIAGVV